MPRIIFDVCTVQNICLNTSYGKVLLAQVLCKGSSDFGRICNNEESLGQFYEVMQTVERVLYY